MNTQVKDVTLCLSVYVFDVINKADVWKKCLIVDFYIINQSYLCCPSLVRSAATWPCSAEL